MGFVCTPSIHLFPNSFRRGSQKGVKLPSYFHLSVPLEPNIRKWAQKSRASFDSQSFPPDIPLSSRKRLVLYRNEESLLVPFCSKDASSGEKDHSACEEDHKALETSSGEEDPMAGEEDHKALETVLKLYTAIKKRNVRELSEVIGDECRCVCNFISYFQPFYGKKQVLEFFTFLLGYMGKHIEFVVQPTLQDGLNVGVHWKLEWKKTRVPLGNGISFYMCHVYQGKMVIRFMELDPLLVLLTPLVLPFVRNIEMFIEPLLHIEPLRLKLVAFVMPVMDRLGGTKRRVIHLVLCLVFVIAFLLMFNYS